MKPLGRKHYRNPHKVDHHVRVKHHKVPNWWEVEPNQLNKARDKRIAAQEVQDEVTTFTSSKA